MTSTPKRRWRVTAALAVIASALVLAACGGDDGDSSSRSGNGSGGGETVELRFSYFSGEKTSFGMLWDWWMDEVEKRSDGQVTFERFWDASLLGPTEVVEGLKDGRVDIAQVSTPYYPGSFPLSTVTELPFVTDSLPAVSAAFAELEESNEALKQEWAGQGLEPVAFNGTAGSALGTQTPVTTIEDLDGLRIRAVDRGSQVLKDAGANTVNVEVPDLYGAMQRDLINAYYGVPFSFVGPLKLTEVTEHLTDMGLGVPALNTLAMSTEGWDQLSQEVKDVMAEVSAEVPEKSGEFEAEAEQVTCDAAKQEGIEMSVLDEAEVQKLRDLGEQRLHDEWVDEVSEKDVPAEEFFDEYVEVVQKFEDEYEFTPGLQRCMEDGSN